MLTSLFLAGPVSAQQNAFSVHTYSVEEATTLNVATPSGDIEIISEEGREEVRVELYVERGISIWSRSRNMDNYRITNQKRGREIVASVEPRGSFMSDHVTFTYRVFVPPRIDTQLRTTSGDITLENLRGHQQLFTGSGDIDVSGNEGRIDGKTHQGNIRLRECEGEVRLSILNGEIDAEKMRGVMVARVTSGDIRALYDKVSQGISLETVRGDIWLELPQQPFEFRARGSQVNFRASGDFNGIRRVDRVEGTYGEGGGPRVTLSSVSGSITVETR